MREAALLQPRSGDKQRQNRCCVLRMSVISVCVVCSLGVFGLRACVLEKHDPRLAIEKALEAGCRLSWRAAFFPEVGISQKKYLCLASARVRQRCRLRPCIVATILAALPLVGVRAAEFFQRIATSFRKRAIAAFSSLTNRRLFRSINSATTRLRDFPSACARRCNHNRDRTDIQT